MRRIIYFMAILSVLCFSVHAKADQYTVPSDGSFVYSQVLELNQIYEIVAQGTYLYNTPKGRIADANWSIAEGTWVENAGDNPDWGGLNLVINNQFVEWLGSADGVNYYPHTFSPDHVYKIEYMGQGSSISFRIWDSPGYYGDNSGNLTVSVNAVQEPPPPEPTPEPATMLLLGLGLVGLAGVRRRFKK